MQHKFPFVSLHIQMEGNDLDVNVHPSKMEVRFARGTEVYDAVYEIDLSTLRPTVAFPHLPENTKTVDEAKGLAMDQVVIGSCTMVE